MQLEESLSNLFLDHQTVIPNAAKLHFQPVPDIFSSLLMMLIPQKEEPPERMSTNCSYYIKRRSNLRLWAFNYLYILYNLYLHVCGRHRSLSLNLRVFITSKNNHPVPEKAATPFCKISCKSKIKSLDYLTTITRFFTSTIISVHGKEKRRFISIFAIFYRIMIREIIRVPATRCIAFLRWKFLVYNKVIWALARITCADTALSLKN